MLYRLPVSLQCSIFTETGNFLDVDGGQANAVSEAKYVFPNTDLEDEKTNSVLDE
jgi:hypothetical protein